MRIQVAFLALAVGGALTAQTPAVNEQAIIRMAKTIQREILTLPEYGVFDSIRFSFKGTPCNCAVRRPVLP